MSKVFFFFVRSKLFREKKKKRKSYLADPDRPRALLRVRDPREDDADDDGLGDDREEDLRDEDDVAVG